MLHPDYSVVKRNIKKNPQKESYRGLTYAYMEHYILMHDESGEVMKIKRSAKETFHFYVLLRLIL